MLRIHFLQQWFNLSDPGVEALYASLESAGPAQQMPGHRLGRTRRQLVGVIAEGSLDGDGSSNTKQQASSNHYKSDAQARLAKADASDGQTYLKNA
jgi:hypothetical protein